MRDEFVDRLRRLDVCAVSDALDRTGLPPAVVNLRQLTVVRPVAGRAVTVGLGAATGRQPSRRHLGTAAVEAAGPGTVVVVANDGRVDCAGWGGLLSTAAALRGVEGIVIDGACRDIPEAIDVGLAVHARAPVAVTARGRVIEVSWNEPVEIDGVTVTPGDLVVADGSGVAFVPADRAQVVLAAAEEIAEGERVMAAALRDGVPVSQVMAGDYERLLDRADGS
jgi:regulator of RNase E activity RraA